jgi:DNA repair protein RecN (Recombination protein N)
MCVPELFRISEIFEMLSNLRIKNYALVDQLEVEFQPGLNVITGATGAGKSIIVGAANMVLGERASIETVRSGFETASIEAVFSLSDDRNLKDLLGKLGLILTDDLLIIRREISSRGQSKCFINDQQVTLGSLKSLGDRLADLHGQHQHQSLLNVERHVEYLDHYGALNDDLSGLSETFRLLRRKQNELEELINSRKMDQERRQLYQFQIQEIERSNLSPDEEGRLIGERRILENAESLFELSSRLYDQLHESEASLLERLTSLSKELKGGVGIDSRLKEPNETLESCLITLQEVARFMEDYKGSLEFDPDRLEMIRERLDLLNTLKRKYDKSIEEILIHKEQIEKDLGRIENKDETINGLKEEINKLSQTLQRECILLSQKRRAKASDLSKKIQKALSTLGMDKTRFEIRITQKQDENGLLELDGKRYLVDDKGMDQVEFFVSPNPGEELKPLAKIASGGEISRIMLALKSILAKTDQVETMIFDEIDVGIGGEVASAVGKSLKDLASSHQVIVITHLQQIASQADHHFKVFKESAKKRTVTRITRLDEEERVKEIARMISGEKVSQVTLKQAKEMIKTTENSSDN